MKKTEHPFDTPEEALAFLEGIEFVNDSTIEAYIEDENDCVVITEDDDGEDEEE